MSDNEKKNESKAEKTAYSLNDDRRVKVLSPGALVAKRFFRNRLAIVGLVILVAMFLFSFVGGLLSPYDEDQFFYRTELMYKEVASATENTEYRYLDSGDGKFTSIVQAKALLAIQKNTPEFTYSNITYTVAKEGEDFYSVALDGVTIGMAYKDIITKSDEEISFGLKFASIKAYTNGEASFEYEGEEYTIDENAVVFLGEKEVAYISRFVAQAIMPDVVLSRDFKEELTGTLVQLGEISASTGEFNYEEEDGTLSTYVVEYLPEKGRWAIKQQVETKVYDIYASPSAEHWLGTDKNGMDMLTRLMYGGRVSLVIGFIVEFISTFIGIILGGLSGYLGGWVDNLIMRIVDIFYCIPSLPIIIILGAAMDAMSVDPTIRMVYLMLILGFLGWPGIARLVRGQILSLREQEFMTATEACGISTNHRIFKHLIPNVIPQLIVSCTMGLGGTIITEATLSFLGLGVKFPFASWGNIINDVNNTFVLKNYWFIWVPAGVLLLLTVLAFNICGDGLRDAFDPKMKR